jgi:hypothetical protein
MFSEELQEIQELREKEALANKRSWPISKISATSDGTCIVEGNKVIIKGTKARINGVKEDTIVRINGISYTELHGVVELENGHVYQNGKAINYNERLEQQQQQEQEKWCTIM